MSDVAPHPSVAGVPGLRLHPALVCMAMVAPAATLSVIALEKVLPVDLWWRALWTPDRHDVRQLLAIYSLLPRLAVSLLCGAALGLCGTLFQRVLRNPLAEPTTLGTSAGAQLALVGATLYAPTLLAAYPEAVALLGAGVATVLVFGLAWQTKLSSLSLIMAGLVVTLFGGSVSAILTIFKSDRLSAVFIWGSGSLVQGDWSGVEFLLPRVFIGALFATLLARPLTLLALDDEAARSAGLALRQVQFVALGVAIALGASVVCTVGVIGFIGLAAPNLARLSGARRFSHQLVWSPLIGAALLWLTDQIVQLSNGIMPGLPTGVATAMLGALCLIGMLPQLKSSRVPSRLTGPDGGGRATNPGAILIVAALLLIAAVWIALDLGQGIRGWEVSGWGQLHQVLPWRLPRVGAAMAAGAMLATAGVMTQRLTGNVMASPEVLGVSSGAAFGVVALVFLSPSASKLEETAAAGIGAFAALAALLGLSLRSAFSPERMLLSGIALGTACAGGTALVLSSGNPHATMLLSWLAGSTYSVTAFQAAVSLAFLAMTLALLPMMVRWLTIMPLGEATGRSLGLDIAGSRLVTVLVCAALAAGGTLTVGPLSFVGLLGPHMARMMGLQRPLAQLYAAAAIGGIVMVLADWLGRNLLFPYQIPAGLLATLLGGPYFMWLMRRKHA